MVRALSLSRKRPILHRQDRKPNSVLAGYFSVSAGRPALNATYPRAKQASFSALLFGLAPDGVCLAPPVARRAVVSYTAVSPLPAGSCPPAGGLFSAALSVAPEFPPKPPRVTRHPGLAEFGLSSPALRQKQPAVLSVCFFKSQPQNIFPQSSHSTTCVNLCISMVSCGRSIVPHPPQELFTIVIAATPLPAFARICS